MKFLTPFLILFLSLNSAGQNSVITDSLSKKQFEEMNNFFMNVDSMNLPESVKTELQYKKIKSFIQTNPTNEYNAMFVSWGKYFDQLKIDSLYSLMDSSLQKQMMNQREYQKIRSTIIPGMPFPEFILTDTLNKHLNIADLKGKIVFIDIWASSCEPCRKEMPKLKSLYEKYKDKGFIVIAISLDDDKKKWINAIAKDGQLWPQFCELKTWRYNSMYNKWGIVWLPYNFLIDRQGKLSDKEINIDKLEEKILTLQ